MRQLIPNQFLFRFTYSCRYRAKMPIAGSHVVNLPAECAVPFLGGMDGERPFADVRMAWNENGLGLQWEIRLKEEPIYGEVDRPRACDGLSLWLDARDTRSIHRASRYCQRLLFLAANGHDPPVADVRQQTIARALESPPAADLSQVRIVRLAIDEDGEILGNKPKAAVTNYRVEVFLPAGVLHGYDPEVNRRLGFFYRVRDRELGDQLLCAGPELPYWEDPSLWSTLDLQGEGAG